MKKIAFIETYKLKRLPPGITEADIKQHVIDPEELKDIDIEEADDAPAKRKFKVPKTLKNTKSGPPKFDITQFAENLHSVISPLVVGYMLHVRQKGKLIYEAQWKYAQTPSDLKLPWSADVQMDVASVSKLLTAVGLVKLLGAKKIALDETISRFLPADWTKGDNIDQITFWHLLTHNSGFDNGKSSATDYNFMKSKVAAGVKTVAQAKKDEICIGRYHYQNMNFGLMRILMPIIGGDVDKTMTASNEIWDGLTISFYREYMRKKVFQPAGVTKADFKPVTVNGHVIGGALAYKFPPLNSSGYNSGNLQTKAGGGGWRLSIKELLDVMHHFRRKNTIIASTTAQMMLDGKLGIGQIENTAAGNIYSKNGGHSHKGRKEQCVAYFLPDDMEMAIFVNSPVGAQDFKLSEIVSDTLKNTLPD